MTYLHLWRRVILPTLIVSLCVGSPANAQTARQIAQKTLSSVVLLVMQDAHGQPVSLGSGFFVGNRVIATNLHVIAGATKGYAKLVGKRPKHKIAGIVGIDNRRDLVLLAVPAVTASLLTIGDSQRVVVSDTVYVAGNPKGLEGTFSQGIVSGVRNLGSDTLLQITAPISPGSSGGPVLNAQGKVIGVAVATFKGGQNLNFAIPSSYLSVLLSNIKPLTPLSRKTRVTKHKSILADFGGRSSEGVGGIRPDWKYYTLGDYSFSLRNKLKHPVKNVYCIVVFYDKHGEPLDVDVVRYHGIIPAGLAKRVTSEVDSSLRNLTSKIEFRVLNFEIEQ